MVAELAGSAQLAMLAEPPETWANFANSANPQNGQRRQVARLPALSLLKHFGKRTCKPNFVVYGHSSRRRVTADTHQRPTRRFRQLLKPPGRIGQMRNVPWLFKDASLPIWSCSVWGLPCPGLYSPSGALLPHHFTLTPALRPGLARRTRQSCFRGALPKEG